MAKRSLLVAKVLSVFALGCGLVGLLGWVLDIQRLADWDGTGLAIKPNGAVCVMLCGTAIMLIAGGRQKIGARIGILAAVIGTLTLFEHLTQIDLFIDRLLTFGRTWKQTAAIAPERMGVSASFSFTLLGTGFLLLAIRRGRRYVPMLALVVIGIASISFIGYIKGVEELYLLPGITAIGWPMSAVLLALAFGLLASVPDEQPTRLVLDDGTAGMLLRRALPPVVLGLLFVGEIRRAGENAGLYEPAMGMALSNIVVIGLMVGVLLLVGRQAARFERRTREADEAERRVSTLARMMTAQENERRRIAFELHDGLGQHMTALRFQVQALYQKAGGDGLKESVNSLAATAEAIDSGLTDIVSAFRPRSLDTLGLNEALGQLVINWQSTTGIPAEFHANGYYQGMISDEAETALYRILQEALNNCGKHSGASFVNAMLTKRRNHIALVIEDDGCGFDSDAATPGLGLVSMRERAELAGGSLDIESDGSSGTTVLVTIPLDR